MRASLKILVAAAATLLVAPQLAMADDIEAQLRAMNERMAELETQLQATNDELQASKETVEAQQDVIEKAGLERQAQSGLSAFLSQTQFEGYVAVSWNWNFNDPDDTALNDGGGARFLGGYTGVNSGALGLTAPHHSHPNSFQLDQFFLSMHKPATAESRGGFGVDIAYGEAAEIQTGNGPGGGGFAESADLTDLAYLHQAYVEYLAPVGNGVNVKMGRFATLIGYEQFRADSNHNITRGLLWGLQPVSHTGVLVSGRCDCGFVWALGGVNGYSTKKWDTDADKGLIGRVGYETEMFAFHVNGYWGGDTSDVFGLGVAGGPGSSDDELGVIDAVLTVNPVENLELWANFDYFWTADASLPFGPPVSSITVYGIAAGGRLAVTDRMGVALRYEWIEANDHIGCFGTGGPFFCGAVGQDAHLQEITGTIDYALTDNLTVKLEGRYDWFTSQRSADNFFVSSSTPRSFGGGDNARYTKEDQVLALIQAIYKF